MHMILQVKKMSVYSFLKQEPARNQWIRDAMSGSCRHWLQLSASVDMTDYVNEWRDYVGGALHTHIDFLIR